MPCGDWKVPIEMAKYLMSLESDGIEIWFWHVVRQIIHRARNILMKEAIDWDFDHIRFLDDDNIPEQFDALKILLADWKDIVTGIYRGRQYPNMLTVFKEKFDADWFVEYEPYTNLNVSKWPVVEIANCGTGCVIISRKVICDMMEKYNEEPFEFPTMKYIKTPEWVEEFTIEAMQKIPDWEWFKMCKKHISEDLLFFERAKRMWYKIYADTRVTLDHIWLAEIVKVGENTFIK